MSDELSTAVVIRILTAYDKGGMEAVNAELAKMKGKTDAASHALDEHGEKHESVRHKVHATHLAMQGLGEILHGNVAGGIAEVSRGLIGLVGVVGKLAVWGSVAAMVVQAIAHMSTALDGLKKKHDEVADAAKKDAAALGEVNETTFDKLKRELEDLRRHYENVCEAEEAVYSANMKLVDAELGRDLQKLDTAKTKELANPNLTDAQRAQINEKYQEKKEQRQQAGEELKAIAELQHAQKQERDNLTKICTNLFEQANILQEQNDLLQARNAALDAAKAAGFTFGAHDVAEQTKAYTEPLQAAQKKLEEYQDTLKIRKEGGWMGEGEDAAYVKADPKEAAYWQSKVDQQQGLVEMLRALPELIKDALKAQQETPGLISDLESKKEKLELKEPALSSASAKAEADFQKAESRGSALSDEETIRKNAEQKKLADEIGRKKLAILEQQFSLEQNPQKKLGMVDQLERQKLGLAKDDDDRTLATGWAKGERDNLRRTMEREAAQQRVREEERRAHEAGRGLNAHEKRGSVEYNAAQGAAEAAKKHATEIKNTVGYIEQAATDMAQVAVAMKKLALASSRASSEVHHV